MNHEIRLRIPAPAKKPPLLSRNSGDHGLADGRLGLHESSSRGCSLATACCFMLFRKIPQRSEIFQQKRFSCTETYRKLSFMFEWFRMWIWESKLLGQFSWEYKFTKQIFGMLATKYGVWRKTTMASRKLRDFFFAYFIAFMIQSFLG